MIQLYYNPYSRASRVRWLLEELGQKYELIHKSFENGDLETPEFLQLHPHGMLPVLVDSAPEGNLKMFESGAMLIYLADRYSEKRLAPPIADSRARAEYLQWIFYGMTEVEPPVVQVYLHTDGYDEKDRDPRMEKQARERFAERAAALNSHLLKQPFMMGREFSAADVLLGGMLEWSRTMDLLHGHAALERYVESLSARPAFQAARRV